MMTWARDSTYSCNLEIDVYRRQAEGLKATRVLSAEGIKVNVTLIFTANQALLAARAGAAFVSPFLGRLDDISQPGIALIRTIMETVSYTHL